MSSSPSVLLLRVNCKSEKCCTVWFKLRVGMEGISNIGIWIVITKCYGISSWWSFDWDCYFIRVADERIWRPSCGRSATILRRIIVLAPKGGAIVLGWSEKMKKDCQVVFCDLLRVPEDFDVGCCTRLP